MLGNPLDLALYLLFFPIMIAGPVITYSSFAMITKEESISFDISRAASGIRIFAVGFIKRIAIGAVLFKSYSFLVSFSNDSPNILLVLIMLILVYTAVFFTISGYADMGVGLARIYGISLNYKGASNPFRIPTITEYFRITFRGLSEWVDETLVEPTLSLTKGKAPYIVRTVFYSITSILFVRSTLSSLALIVPMLILFYATFRGQLERRLSTRTGLRALCSLTTILAVAILWVFTLIGDFNSFTSYFSGLTGTNPEYYLDKIFLSVSALKYLFVILITALIIWMSRIEEHLDAPTASPGRVYATVQYIAPILTLILFITTILFFLPQFSVYDTVPFTKLFV